MSSPLSQHEHFMRLAIETAGQAMAAGNHPFGALLVHNDKILIVAQNTVMTERDITRHAELNLVSQACRIVEPDRLAECLLMPAPNPAPCVPGPFSGPESAT